MTGNVLPHCTLCSTVLPIQRPPSNLPFQNAVEDSNMFITICKFNPLLPLFSTIFVKVMVIISWSFISMTFIQVISEEICHTSGECSLG